MRVTYYLAALLVAVALVASGCGGGAEETTTSVDGTETTAGGQTTGEELVIGYAGDFSGDGAVGDVPAREGAELAVAQLNEAGGIAGRPIRLIAKDMKGDPALGATVTQELLDAGAVAVIGPPFPGQAVGVIQTAARQEVAVISATATQPEYPVVGGAQAFLAAFGDNVQAAAAAEYALEQGYKSAFTMVSPDLSYTAKTPEWFIERFEQGGGQGLGSESFSLGQQDFGPQVTKIAALNPRPDVIYTAMFPPDIGVFLRQLRGAGVQVPVIGADGLDSQAFLDAAGSDAEGAAFTTHGFASEGSTFKQFVDSYTAAKGRPSEAPAFTALGGDAIFIIKAAVEKAGSSDPATITAALKEIENLELMTGTISYKGTSGVPLKTVTIGAVEKGGFILKKQSVPANIPTP